MLARTISDEDGANAVEFALLLPVLVVLLFGTIYGASLFNSQQTVTQAAREGARFGATLPLSEFGDTVPPSGTDWFAQVEQRSLRVLDVDRPLTPGAVAVCVRFYDVDGSQTSNGAASCPPPAPAGDLQGARVEVSVSRGATLELGVAAIGPLDLTSSAVARYEPDDLDD